MKTLILYSSKYGCTKKCGELLKAGLMGDVDLVSINEGIPRLSNYDQVILGSSVYIGKINKKLKQFCEIHLEELTSKRIGLYTCSLQLDQDVLSNFPQDLQEVAVASDNFGGEIRFKKLNWFERMITKMVSKSNKNFPELDENHNIATVSTDKINKFIEQYKTI
jgi:menaquinone-dependent protoporphyrinogen oxidase